MSLFLGKKNKQDLDDATPLNHTYIHKHVFI